MTRPGPQRSAVIHGHFYQPPREGPWLDQVEREPNAAPWHDWNERIDHECYRAVLAARLVNGDGTIRRIVNTLEWISFNVGPTLLDWMERDSPGTYQGILAADRASVERLGHGNAIAMPYHHIIMPLASRRDKSAEVRWGIADFRRRFGREPAGMWLPETAVDDETLDVLAEQGIAFTIVAPHQVSGAPPDGMPGRYRTGGGRTIALIPYDGALAHDVAFGPLVRDAGLWVKRVLAAGRTAVGPHLSAIATDGETFGHHHKFGDMALAAAIDGLARSGEVRIDNFGSFLSRNPATAPVALLAPSSWSCVHGVERWRSNCGCRMTGGTSQAWRAPLRTALEWLGGELTKLFEREGTAHFGDPWEAREAYVIVGPPSGLPVRARELIELMRNAARMFTSCGWFFDDVAGIETIQVLKYAARALELAGPERERLEAGLVARLEAAVSNDRTRGTAATLYRTDALPRWSGEARAAAGYAAVSALCPEQARQLIGGYLVGARGLGVVETQHRRTGAVRQFGTHAHRTGGFGIEVDLVGDDDGSSLTLPLEALPERERRQAREVLRREALRDVLGAEDLVRLAHGSTTYGEALRMAVIRLVPDEISEATPDRALKLLRALELLTIEEIDLPFDAQTRLFHLLEHATDQVRGRFAAVAARMGFGRDAFQDLS